ncbi:MAG: hypothetical protein A3D74_03060 [Candidatus Levybacteria bacterium RIFCSPHIGHO2_02_FULL_37_13]|nr:MAG: hypothetical protein A3D74_03060 [Candidatus Levybacteria bacterium RIFCSPHIGHO2_02_FULL_37_13]OGH30625.1 MAG: hypothetical protein A3E40_00240 [Candidatus Levybacteria bacterium RIFCSPHIGHO2_12_FULL_37_9]
MTNFDFSPYKGLYLKTAREYIVKIKQNVQILSKEPENMKAANVVYISSHSLGSQSTLTNFKNMESVCALIEHIFLKIKEGKLKISKDLLKALTNSITGLTNCVDSIDKVDKETDLSDIKTQLNKL